MNPIGKRVFGPVARELREKYIPITNMAEEVLKFDYELYL